MRSLHVPSLRPRMAVVAVVTDAAPTSGRGIVEHVRRGPHIMWSTHYDDTLPPDMLLYSFRIVLMCLRMLYVSTCIRRIDMP